MSGSISPMTRSVSILRRARRGADCPRRRKGAAPARAKARRESEFIVGEKISHSPRPGVLARREVRYILLVAGTGERPPVPAAVPTYGAFAATGSEPSAVP